MGVGRGGTTFLRCTQMTTARILRTLALAMAFIWPRLAQAQICTICDGQIGGCWITSSSGWNKCTNLPGGSCLLEGPCTVEFASELSGDGLRTDRRDILTTRPQFEQLRQRPALVAGIFSFEHFQPVVTTLDCAGYVVALFYDPRTAKLRRESAKTIII